jgi:hypothetical protein
VVGGGDQLEAELADLSVEFADLAAQPLDVGAGGQVDRMQNPRALATIAPSSAWCPVRTNASSRGARRFSIASYAS